MGLGQGDVMRGFMISALGLLAGCQGIFGGGQSGEDTIVCGAIETVELGTDEVSALGFAPADILAFSAGDRADTLVYADSSTTGVTIGLATGSARFEDREWIDDATGEPAERTDEIDDCGDVVAIDGDLNFSTDDGQFDEGADVVLESADGESAAIYAMLDPEALGGTYTLDFDPADYDDVRLHLSVVYDASGTTGEISGDRSLTDGDVASDEMFEVATF
jgi:hypothetical protein